MGQHRDGELILDGGGLTTGPLAVTACMVGYFSGKLLLIMASELHAHQKVSWQDEEKDTRKIEAHASCSSTSLVSTYGLVESNKSIELRPVIECRTIRFFLLGLMYWR